MKRLRNLMRNRMSRTLLASGLAATAVFLWGCGAYMAETYAGGNVVSASDDVQYLEQYGDWIDVEPYGMVWQPSVVDGWEPFYYGHWDWTDDGWAWVSYEPYGWLVYHYGYWDYAAGTGWFWISGDQWSPACVDWITYGDYIGWAPLPPPGVVWPEPWVHHNIGAWNVVRIRDFDRDNVGRYRITKPPRVGELSQARMDHHPPSVQMIETMTRRKIPRVPIERHSMNMAFRQPERRGNEAQFNLGPGVEHRPPEGQGNQGEFNRGPGEQQRSPEQGQTARQGERGPDHEPQRMVLPKREQQRVEKNRGRVERNVLRPRPENRARGQEHGRAQNGGTERGQGGEHDNGGGHRR